MRTLINWKSPPQKGNREPIRWGLPGLLWKKNPHTWGRKLSSHFPEPLIDFTVKKESPYMGTKTGFNAICIHNCQPPAKKHPHTWGRKRAKFLNPSLLYILWKKHPHTWGRKHYLCHRCIIANHCSCEKSIPTHGDENLSSTFFASSSWKFLWKKNPRTWGRKHQRQPSAFNSFLTVKKESPYMGTKTSVSLKQWAVSIRSVKKESPYMGTIHFPVLYQFLVDDSYLHVAML